ACGWSRRSASPAPQPSGPQTPWRSLPLMLSGTVAAKACYDLTQREDQGQFRGFSVFAEKTRTDRPPPGTPYLRAGTTDRPDARPVTGASAPTQVPKGRFTPPFA